MTRRRALVLSLVVSALAVGAVSAATAWWSRPDLGPVIATVDGTEIRLEQARSRWEGLASIHDQAIEDEAWAERVLASLVDDVLVAREAERAGVVPSDDQVDAAVGDVRAGFASDQEFQEWLAGAGIDLGVLEDRVRLNLQAGAVYLEVTEDVTVTQAEIRAYYDEHLEDYELAEGDTVPLLEVEDEIRDILTKAARDTAYAAWIEGERSGAEVEVVMDGWWREL